MANETTTRTETHSTHGSHSGSHAGGAARAKSADEKMAEDKKQLAQEREQRAKDIAEREKKRGTPTPTQEECDLAKLGHHPELANDGSGPDPNDALNTTKHIGGKPAGEYATRHLQSK